MKRNVLRLGRKRAPIVYFIQKTIDTNHRELGKIDLLQDFKVSVFRNDVSGIRANRTVHEFVVVRIGGYQTKSKEDVDHLHIHTL